MVKKLGAMFSNYRGARRRPYGMWPHRVAGFTQHRRGVYRIRYRFKGSRTIAGGYVQQAIKITRG